MVRYLSDDWLTEAGRVLAADRDLAAATSDLELTIAYEVTGTPDGKRTYAVEFDHGRVTLHPTAPPSPQVTFTLDYDTAAEIARGELPAQVAFMQGRLKLGGDVTVLIRAGSVLDGIGDALSDLRARTEF